MRETYRITKDIYIFARERYNEIAYFFLSFLLNFMLIRKPTKVFHLSVRHIHYNKVCLKVNDKKKGDIRVEKIA